MLAGGFVLGEVGILHGSAVMELMLAAAVPVLAGALARRMMISGGTASGAEKSAARRTVQTGRSIWLWLLPVFFLAGMLRAGQEQAVCRAEEELALGLDGTTALAEGTVWDLDRSGDWLVVTVKDVRMETGGKLRRVQVYVEAEEKEAVGEKAAAEKKTATGERAAAGEKVAAEEKAAVEKAATEKETEGGEGTRSLERPQDQEQSLEHSLGIGNRVRIVGEWSAFESARNPGAFDYQKYYRSLKLSGRIFADRVEIVSSARHLIRDRLCRMSLWAGEQLDLAAGEDGGIFRALMLGDKDGLPEDVRQMYQDSGIAHLLAISGLHLSLVSAAVYGLCRRAGAGFCLSGFLGGGVLAAYAVMAGQTPSLIRALVMALCGFAAAALGRTYDLLSALSLAGLCLLWEEPYLIDQAGVQLSFGALIGIGAAAPRLAAVFRPPSEETDRTPGQKPFISGFCVSAGMQLITAPLVLYHFFQLPPYGIFLNLVTVPLMGTAVASGAAGMALAGAGWVSGGRFAAGTGRLILDWYAWCCQVFERLPGSVMTLGKPGLGQIGLYYGILILLLGGTGRKAGTRGQDGGSLAARFPKAAAAVLFLSVGILAAPAVSGLQVTFLDVGQGDGICLRTKKSTLLIDGGSTDEKNLGEACMEPFLKSQGITWVDYAVVSHGDQDHISGIKDLLGQESGIHIRNLVLPAAGQGDEAYARLEELAIRQGSKVLWMRPGDQIVAGELRLRCLFPPASQGRPDKERNEHSLVLHASYKEADLLFTGDMSRDGEQELLEQGPGLLDGRSLEVLKIAHHGSDSSTSEAWLDALQPVWAVVSYGEGNRYGHPHDEVMEALRERGILVYETAKTGAAVFWTDGEEGRWEWEKDDGGVGEKEHREGYPWR